jgi:outer membrane receptor protein involved in Fe transport
MKAFLTTPSASTLVVALASVTFAQAQTIPTAPSNLRPEEQSVVELSPFVISSTSDTGWVATETLAGSRLRTNFKDVPNQIETLTKDFMDDLAVTTIDQALIYTANSENSSDYMPATPGNQVSNPARGGRIRGIGSGTLSRNFFQVHNPTDNFNIERATVATGPNAILFGLGSPAGIFDATPARALLNRNRYGFQLQYDSEDSRRGTFDANVVVKPQVLALRLMGLSKREYTQKQPNLDRDDRLYAALTFTPFKSTTIILQGERATRSWNRAGRIVPTDFVTPWINADKVAGSGYTVSRPAFNNNNLTGIANNRIFAQQSVAPVIIQDGAVPIMNWRNSVTVRNPATLPGVDQTFDAQLDVTLIDPKIFPFDVNIVGESRTTLLGA